MKNYISQIDTRRLLLTVLGNVFLGMGISLFKLSGMGTDPFSGMVMGLSEYTGILYANFQVLVNIVLFIIEFIASKWKFVGAGTFVNAVFLGYITTFFHNIWLNLLWEPKVFWQQFIFMAIGVIVCSFGLSMYQTSDMGVAPFDSFSLILKHRFPKISYFWYRMLTDIICAFIGFLSGGVIGLGTLVCAFGLGPIIHFFDINFTKKILAKGEPKYLQKNAV